VIGQVAYAGLAGKWPLNGRCVWQCICVHKRCLFGGLHVLKSKPRRLRTKSSIFILRSGLMFLLCRSVFSMTMANASRNTVSARRNWRTTSGLHSE